MIDIQKIAKLARLELTSKEKAKYTGELSSILEYIEKLQGAETKGVEPTAQVTGLKNVMRADKINKQQSKKTRQGILDNAPERDGDSFKVRSVF
ncbi:Asp-tRNA(Asn)/Glu-tRNA(Gln) amidotransferase subunit GatC [Patescibacteria group bacterium]|nr:Asp-tRNA(Asn)/Glu-tRNA(Gln) amidotransferase subunit GatC [Patescibacteria group bacterium]MBU4512352.1 Asp-tRNA(Asn)/Glu-tRNA(Gln) amidotransferase subunit GatC [Patescibacteria group bacterium]MCG2692779.1 Asp-tRNA(Asn)/Glu-tRNA(Gln) amidotransferase subunit GatC [Candidatus Parcubacteria bacterium]